MKGIGTIVVVLVGVLVAGGVVAALILRPGSSGGGGARFRATPAELALVRAKIPVVDALAQSIATGCRARRGSPDAPAPTTPITAWPETVSMRTACMYETSPGSGNASGGGYASFGTPPGLNGGWHAFGPKGWLFGRCTITGKEDCAGFSVFDPDPRYVQIDAFRRFPTNDGWAHIEVLLLRRP